MTILLFSIIFLGGFVLSRIVFSGSMTPLEKRIFSELNSGRRVIICFDNEAHIMEKYEGKYRLSVGTADFLGDNYGLESTSMGDNNSLKLVDTNKDDSDGSSGTGLH